MTTVRFADDRLYDEARSVLRGAGFDDATIKQQLKVGSIDEARKLGRTALLARTASGTPLDTLIRCLLCGHDVGGGAFERAVAPMAPSAWVEAGVVARDGDVVRPLLAFTPLVGKVFVHDLGVPAGTKPRADYVMGAASSSMTLANITVRRKCGTAMDLGTGCGVQAVLAADHCERVIATDMNERAVMLAAFTARLNGHTNVEAKFGSLYEPVEGLGFDMVVSNPPFVISPSKEFIYRDGGLHGDGISEAVIRGAAERLNPGGTASILCNWAHLKGRDWQERLASWAGATGCDMWVLRSWASDPSEYAARWLTHSENLEGEGLRTAHREWMEYYEAAGIEAMGSGVVTLRRSGERGASGWARFSEAPDKMLGECGDQVLAMMGRWGAIEKMSDEDVRRAPVRVSPDVRITRETRPATAQERESDGSAWALTSARVRVARGLAYEGTLDPVTLQIMGSLDGRAPVGDVVSAVATGLGLDAGRLMGPVVGVVRKWLELGMVEAEATERRSDRSTEG
ncbi:MAG: methyltransferase [Phycisphaerales bacterium]